MNENLILLAKLLATDENFASELSSKKSLDNKYEFAKTKYNGYTKDEFETFYKQLNSVDQETLSSEELSNVSGGSAGARLAASAFLMLSMASFAPQDGVLAAQQPNFYEIFYNTKPTGATEYRLLTQKPDSLVSGSVLKNKYDAFKKGVLSDDKDKLAEDDNFYKAVEAVEKNKVKSNGKKEKIKFNDIKDEFEKTDAYKAYNDSVKERNNRIELKNKFNSISAMVKNLISSAEELSDSTFETACKNHPDESKRDSSSKYSFSKTVKQHIVYGDYNDMALISGGGHTNSALELMKNEFMQKINYNSANGSWDKDNPLIVDFINQILFSGKKTEDEIKALTDDELLPYKKTAEFYNGVGIYQYLDSSDGHRDLKAVFPEDWNIAKIENAAKLCIAHGNVFEGCKSQINVYIAVVDNVCTITTVNNEDKILSVYPADNQLPTSGNTYEVEDPSNNKRRISMDIPVVE